LKIAVLGGASVRTPLLVRGLSASGLPIREIALYDPDQDRLALVARVARELADGRTVTACAASAAAIDGADFVFTSIRAGGIEARAHDETAALAHGVVGQETVGPAGFAMALRNIPPLVSYAREVERLAPRAWLINFTNPVGIVMQAVRDETDARAIGICDTPTELFDRTAEALGLPAAECHFDYFGLNHLGWLREVRHRGERQLARLWAEPQRIAGLYRGELFETDFLARLRLLPTEYLFYYYQPERAVENLRRRGTNRGQVIAGLNARLFTALRAASGPLRRIYEDYLAERDAGYMQLESGAEDTRRPAGDAGGGYDRIALAVVRAIHGEDAGALLPLSVRNEGTIAALADDDVVEVPCLVNGNGALALHVGRTPEPVRDLLLQVKDYERLTARAAVSGSREDALRALARNPLVPSPGMAEALLSDLRLP
jgi:6-phospho-beta-glucosidase